MSVVSKPMRAHETPLLGGALLLSALLAPACAGPPKPEPGATVVVSRAAPDEQEAESDAEAPRPSRQAGSFAGRLRACRRSESDADLSQAREIFQQGIAAFEQAEYARAAESFTVAYEATCSSALLYNLAIALQRIERNADAADALELYLEKEPSNPRSTEVRELLEKLRGPAR
jgi:hypothetical protein